MSPCAHAERLLGLALDRVEALMYYSGGFPAPYRGPLFARIFAGEAVLVFATLSDGSVGSGLADYRDGTVLPDGATLRWETWRQFAPDRESVVAQVRTIEDDMGSYGCALELSDQSVVELRNEGDDLALGFHAPPGSAT
jgi:hypothetical protein